VKQSLVLEGGKMEILIDIPEHQYNNIMTISSVNLGRSLYKGVIMSAIRAIQKGTVLPKGHGDLDAVETEMINGIKAGNYEEGYETYGHINNMDDCVECVRFAPTIIEADTLNRGSECKE
jgi:hypothetical protein